VQTSPLTAPSGKVSILKMRYTTLLNKWMLVSWIGGY
jgi:hypothetical protein